MSIWNFFSRFKYPSQEWLKRVSRESLYTPDIARLYRSEHQLLFVCGDTMSTCSKYTGDEVRCHSFTLENFMFVENNDLQIPLEGRSQYIHSAKIFGEIHKITTDKLVSLDNTYLNRVQFKRRLVRLITPHRYVLTEDPVDIDGRSLPLQLQGKKRGDVSSLCYYHNTAWMYIGISKHWEPQVDGGFMFRQVRTLYPIKEKNWLRPRYYHYKNE